MLFKFYEITYSAAACIFYKVVVSSPVFDVLKTVYKHSLFSPSSSTTPKCTLSFVPRLFIPFPPDFFSCLKRKHFVIRP